LEDDDDRLRADLHRLDPGARSELRRLLFADRLERDRAAEAFLRRRTPGATVLAEYLDLLSLNDEARRQVVRVLGEIEASG
jgi:hypothetical protein